MLIQRKLRAKLPKWPFLTSSQHLHRIVLGSNGRIQCFTSHSPCTSRQIDARQVVFLHSLQQVRQVGKLCVRKMQNQKFPARGRALRASTHAANFRDATRAHRSVRRPVDHLVAATDLSYLMETKAGRAGCCIGMQP